MCINRLAVEMESYHLTPGLPSHSWTSRGTLVLHLLPNSPWLAYFGQRIRKNGSGMDFRVELM